MSKSLYRRFLFFKEHAGSVTPPGRAACALALAKAEIAAEDAGLSYVYKFDTEPGWSLGADGEYHAYSAFIISVGFEDDDEQRTTLASIGGIEADAEASFYRVTEAHLALEAFSDAVVTRG